MAQASPPTKTCMQVLQDCDKVVHDLKTVNDDQARTILDQKALIDEQVTQLKDDSAWYHNPLIVGLLGLFVGFAGGTYASHH